MHRRGNGTGTLYLKDGWFRYKYTNALGKKQTIMLKDAEGHRVSKRKDAEKLIVALTAQTLEVDTLKTKTQLLERIAVARGYTCNIPIEGYWERLQTLPNIANSEFSANIRSDWRIFSLQRIFARMNEYLDYCE